MIYTVEDLINDILESYRREGKIVRTDYDSLVIRIYRRNGGRVSLRTVMEKLRKLARLNAVKTVRNRQCSYGVCTSDKTEVVIYIPVLQRMVLGRTITLTHYIQYGQRNTRG